MADGSTEEHDHHDGHSHGNYQIAGDHVLRLTRLDHLYVRTRLKWSNSTATDPGSYVVSHPDGSTRTRSAGDVRHSRTAGEILLQSPSHSKVASSTQSPSHSKVASSTQSPSHSKVASSTQSPSHSKVASSTQSPSHSKVAMRVRVASSTQSTNHSKVAMRVRVASSTQSPIIPTT